MKYILTILRITDAIAAFFTVLFIIGMIHSKPNFIVKILFIVKLIIASLLIYRFGYLKDLKFSDTDRQLVVSSSIYIIILSFMDIITAFEEKIRNFISSIISPSTNTSASKIESTTSSSTPNNTDIST